MTLVITILDALCKMEKQYLNGNVAFPIQYQSTYKLYQDPGKGKSNFADSVITATPITFMFTTCLIPNIL